MRLRFFALLLCALWVCEAAVVVGVEPEETRGLDVVLLLDESGSMRQTDPGNSRIDAANLFLRLCNPSHRVELVAFATNMRILGELRPMGPGTDLDRLTEAVRGIQSSGQWTDIEKALDRALSELVREDRGVPRAVILMTDGQVDLGRGAEEDRASLERIRGTLTTRFVQENIAVHCIAFSPQADLAMLRALSRATQGLCVRGDRPEDLQRLFVRLFEETTQPQTAPIVEGEVLLDGSVREATFLISHPRDATPTRLIRPDETAFTARDFDRQPGVSWFAAPTYDLATVSEPPAGRWKVEPTPDDDESRVVLLTDIELGMDHFEPLARGGETCRVSASLMSGGETIAESEWVSAVSMQATLVTSAPLVLEMKDDGLHADGSAGDGVFGVALPAPAAAGSYDLELIARTPTLERRIVRTLNVVNRWFGVALEKELLGSGDLVRLTVILGESTPVGPGRAVRFDVEVRYPEGLSRSLEAQPVGPGRYEVVFEDTAAVGDYRVTVTGEVREDAEPVLHDTVGPFDFRVQARPHRAAMALPTPSTPTPAPPPAETSEPQPEEPPAPVEVDAGEESAIGKVALVGGVSGAVVLALILVWIRLRRRRAATTSPAVDLPATRVEPAPPAPAPVSPDAPTLTEPPAEAEAPETPSPEPEVEAVPEPSPEVEQPPSVQEQAAEGAEIIPEAGVEENEDEDSAFNRVPLEATGDSTVSKEGESVSVAEKGSASLDPAALSDSEQALLDEILGDADGPKSANGPPSGKAGGAGGTPTIPDETDPRSDQQVLDDILREIKDPKKK
ncbi:VWA domain-containing protein [Candidatus Sumerlaeota bacterium]|nr:VWA domain-containing protein [Candidatus Sumerlaeota bacterium]